MESDWSSSSSFEEDENDDGGGEEERELLRRSRSKSGFGAAMFASRFASNALRGVKKIHNHVYFQICILNLDPLITTSQSSQLPFLTTPSRG